MKLTFKPSPNYRGEQSTSGIMKDLGLCLCAVLLYAVIYYSAAFGARYGLRVVLLACDAVVAALATDANRAALAALGLDKIAAALFAANDAARAAMESRSDERSSRAEEKAAGTTPELRKAVAALLVAAARRVNAVNEIAPSEAASAAIGKVAALVEEYKLVASQFKGKKKEEPEPEPESAPEATTIS